MLNLVFHGLDLGIKCAVRVSEDGGGDDVAGHTASAAEVCLLANIDVRNILKVSAFASYLVLAQEGQVQDDFEWLCVGSEDDEVRQASVQCFGGLIGTLLQLYHLTKGDPS